MDEQNTDSNTQESFGFKVGRRRRIRNMLLIVGAGLLVTALAVLYVVYIVPIDGILDLRESILGLGLLIIGMTLLCWPLIKLIWNLAQSIVGLLSSWIRSLILTLKHRQR